MSATNHVDVAHAQEISAASALSDSPTVAGSPQNSTFASASTGTSEFPAVIPPEHHARTLVLCFDGTGDQSVAESSSLLLKV
jgi:hypothetical protein